MVETTSVLIVGDDKQGLCPPRSISHAVVDIRDKLLTQGHDMRWMLIVGEMIIRKIPRLKEGVLRQCAGISVVAEFFLKSEFSKMVPESSQGQRLRNIMKINFPAVSNFQTLESIVNRRHFIGKLRR